MRDDDSVRDEVHGSVRPLREVIAIARGADLGNPSSPETPISTPVDVSPVRGRVRSLRRGSSEGRGSVRGTRGAESGRDSERKLLDD